MKRKQIKALIELSNSFEEANDIIEQHAGFKTCSEKIAYINGMFDHEIFDRVNGDDEDDYRALLTSVVNKKYNA